MPDVQNLAWLVPTPLGIFGATAALSAEGGVIEIPVWLVPTLLGIGGAIGGTIIWLVRKRIEHGLAKKGRRELTHEADLKQQLKLLRYLNGDLRLKWEWLTTHEDAEDLEKAVPVANEIGTWCYKHSTYFPEKMERTLVGLGHLAFGLATDARAKWTRYGRHQLKTIWEGSTLQKYQRVVEKKLGLG